MSDQTQQNVAPVAKNATETSVQTFFSIKAPANTGTIQTQQPLPETLEGHIDYIQETLGLDEHEQADRKFIERLQSYSTADDQLAIIEEIRKRFYERAKSYQQLQENLNAIEELNVKNVETRYTCLLYTSPSPRDGLLSRMPSSA